MRSIIINMKKDIPVLLEKSLPIFNPFNQVSNLPFNIKQYREDERTKKVMDSLPNLKMIVRYGVGVDTIDIEEATKHNIQVCNVPDYGMNEVADHAIALMMAYNNPKLDLLGITIVAGNQTLEKTRQNGLNVCQALNIKVPVYAGMSLPMVREQVVAANVHGETGLDGPVFEPLKIIPKYTNTTPITPFKIFFFVSISSPND